MRLWQSRRAVLAVLLLNAAAGAVVLSLRTSLWVGGWKVALDWGTGTLVLIAPVCAGSCALLYSTMTARQWPELLAGMQRGWRSWLAPAAGVWLNGVVAMLACTAAALVTALLLGGRAAPAMLWAIPLMSITLGAQTAIGALVGVALPRIFAAPLASVLAFVLEAMSVGGTLPGLFRTGGVTGDLAGQTYSYPALVLQAATCLLLGAACVLALALEVRQTRPLAGWGAVGVALMAAAIPWSALERFGTDRYRFEERPRLVCRGGAPQICLSRDTVRPLTALVREFDRQSTVLAQVGVALPDRYVQDLPHAGRPADGLILFVDDQSSSSSADRRTVALALATPADCRQFHALRAPIRALRARTVLADWIAHHNNVRGMGVAAGSPEARWLAESVTRQSPWVRATFDSLRRCDLRGMRVPF